MATFVPLLHSGLSDLESPSLDLANGDAPEAMLRRLREQNRALDDLRFALAAEETFPSFQNPPVH